MIIPLVKQFRKGSGECTVPPKITCSFCGELGKIGARAFLNFAEDALIVDGEAFISFGVDSSLENTPEIYRVTVGDYGIRVGFRDARGAVNGAASAGLLIRKKKIEKCEIIDYPSCYYRSFLLDMARGLPSMEDLKSTIKYMALAKYNTLHLHLMDTNGPCYLSEAVPEYKFIADGDQCDKAFLKEIYELCRELEIDVVPEIEIPAHGTAVCEAHPEFKCPVENNDGWAICPASEGIWTFYDKLVGEVVEMFPSCKYIHIGTDELEFRDLGAKYYCHWDDCPQCAELRKKEGLADRQAEFYYVVERMHDIVKSYGKKMMMWNDQIDVSKDVPLSREILIEFWRIAYPGRGPYEGCSMEKFLEKGFRLINAYYPYTYLNMDHYLSSEKLKGWTPFNTPEQSSRYAERMIGGESCAWDFGNYEEAPFYGVVIPPVLAVFGDKLWGLGEREYDDDYKAALSEYLFGSDEFVDVFKCVGDIIPPRKKEVAPTLSSKDELRLCTEKLERNKNNNFSLISEKYIVLINKISEASFG